MKSRLIVSLLVVSCLWVAKPQAELPQDTRRHMIYTIASVVTLIAFTAAGVSGYLLIDKTNTDKSIDIIIENVKTMDGSIKVVDQKIALMDADAQQLLKSQGDLYSTVNSKFETLSAEHGKLSKENNELTDMVYHLYGIDRTDKDALADHTGVDPLADTSQGQQLPLIDKNVKQEEEISSLEPPILKRIDGLEERLAEIETKGYDNRIKTLDERLNEVSKTRNKLISTVNENTNVAKANKLWIRSFANSYNGRSIVGRHKAPLPLRSQ